MTASWRAVISIAVGALLPLVAAPFCVLFGIGPNGWFAVSMGLGVVWALMQNRILNSAESSWRELRELSTGSIRDGDGPTLLALFAMHEGPVCLFDVVIVLSPPPDAPSWLHPLRRWNVMIAWAWRNSELVAEAEKLSEAGLLRQTKRVRRGHGMSMYEITGLGRDVAARNAEVLMAGLAEETA